METLKIEVTVNVELSEVTKNFLSALFTPYACTCGCTGDFSEAQKPEVQKPAEKPEVQKPEVQKPAEAASDITIEDVRAVLAEKVNSFRSELKAKMTELGAKNVSTLAPEHYKEFYDYARSL